MALYRFTVTTLLCGALSTALPQATDTPFRQLVQTRMAVGITTPPQNITLSGTVTIAAITTAPASSLQFVVSGSPVGDALTAAPYSTQWDTTSVPDGTYAIQAQATSITGQTASSRLITVSVKNKPQVSAPALISPANGATSVPLTAVLSWAAAANAKSYAVHLGTQNPPPFVTSTSSTTYSAGTLAAGQTYYWYVTASNGSSTANSATWKFTTVSSAPAPVPPPSSGGGSALSYVSPSCGPSGGSTSWACGAWPATTAPALGGANTIVHDPDTGNRVLRVTQSGSFGEASGVAYKAFDGGWRQAWNADDSRFMVLPWSTGNVNHAAYWVQFDAANMSLTGASGPVPGEFSDYQWDQNNPDEIVGLIQGVAKSYNVTNGSYSTVFDPATTNWGAGGWLSAWGGPTVCIAEGPQDNGYRLACHNQQTGQSDAVNLHAQTIGGQPFPVYFQGQSVTLPNTVGVHTITMGLDGRWLAVDTHGNSLCSVGGVNNYASTSLFIDLQNKVGYEWNVACGSTHWAYGYDGIMMQSASPRWTSTGANGPCNSDSRGIARRGTDGSIDSSYATLGPCSFFDPSTWNISVHLSWTNNANDSNVNRYPVVMATTNEGVNNMFLWQDIAAMQTDAAMNQGKIWRFAQHWNDPYGSQCGFLSYSSPSVSRSGRYVLFPSNWRGKTGGNGVCTNGQRTDLFVFELK